MTLKQYTIGMLIILGYAACAKAFPCNMADPNLKTQGRAIYAAALADFKAKKLKQHPARLVPVRDEYPWQMLRETDVMYERATGTLP